MMTMTLSRCQSDLQVSELAGNGTVVVRLSGNVDSFNAERFAHAFSALPSRRMVVDCSEVAYTSSAGLRSILTTGRNCRENGGDLRLAALQPQVSRVLRISGFTSLIKVFDDVASAVASFGAHGIEI